jgi:xanthine/CO dehydrogenase XdhC/CoxF family maturation factor
MSDTAEILDQARRWRDAGAGVAMATVVSTWGSSPRAVGAKLAVADSGAFVGSVSGGCVEGAVVTEGLDVIRDGKPRLLDFGITNDQAWEVGLACGGKIQIFVERVE